MQPEITNRFRIAVALAALSHKPPNQSVADYTLHLMACFPLDGHVEVNGWRQHSLALGDKLRCAVDALQRGKAELDVLRATVAQYTERVIPGGEDHDPRPKKKKKTSQGQAHSAPVLVTDWSTAMRDLDPVIFPPSLAGDLSILSMMAKLNQATLNRGSMEHLLPLTKRCIMSCGGALDQILQKTDASSYQSLTAIGTLFPPLVAQALSLLPGNSLSADTLDVFIRTTYEHILRPTILSFIPISAHRAAKQLRRHARQPVERLPSSTDIRPTLLGICMSTLDAMALTPHLRSCMSLTLAYACTRTIQNGLSKSPLTASQSSTASTRSTADQRVQRLGFRDAFWYLVSILQAAFSVPTEGRNLNAEAGNLPSPLEEATRREILLDLAMMIQPEKDGTHCLGLVERSMLIGAVERAWTTGWIR